MSQAKSKLFGLILFLIIISALFFIALKPEKNIETKIKTITISNNNLFSESSYLSFAKLDQSKNLSELTLPVIQGRLSKHPFIYSTQLEESDFGNVKIKIHEKKLIARIIIDEQTLLLTDRLQLLPQLPNMSVIDLPVISNVSWNGANLVLRFFHEHEIAAARDIILSLKNVNSEIFSALSEINANKGKELTLIFSGIHPIIRIGKTDIVKKVLILEAVWDQLKNESSPLSQSEYLDLRLSNQIYFTYTKNEN